MCPRCSLMAAVMSASTWETASDEHLGAPIADFSQFWILFEKSSGKWDQWRVTFAYVFLWIQVYYVKVFSCFVYTFQIPVIIQPMFFYSQRGGHCSLCHLIDAHWQLCRFSSIKKTPNPSLFPCELAFVEGCTRAWRKSKAHRSPDKILIKPLLIQLCSSSVCWLSGKLRTPGSHPRGKENHKCKHDYSNRLWLSDPKEYYSASSPFVFCRGCHVNRYPGSGR